MRHTHVCTYANWPLLSQRSDRIRCFCSGTERVATMSTTPVTVYSIQEQRRLGRRGVCALRGLVSVVLWCLC
jgi:hypothetical protein